MISSAAWQARGRPEAQSRNVGLGSLSKGALGQGPKSEPGPQGPPGSTQAARAAAASVTLASHHLPRCRAPATPSMLGRVRAGARRPRRLGNHRAAGRHPPDRSGLRRLGVGPDHRLPSGEGGFDSVCKPRHDADPSTACGADLARISRVGAVGGRTCERALPAVAQALDGLATVTVAEPGAGLVRRGPGVTSEVGEHRGAQPMTPQHNRQGTSGRRNLGFPWRAPRLRSWRLHPGRDCARAAPRRQPGAGVRRRRAGGHPLRRGDGRSHGGDRRQDLSGHRRPAQRHLRQRPS